MKPTTKAQACESIIEIRDTYIKEIVKFKSDDEESIVASERKKQVFKQRKAWAEEMGVEGEMIEEIFRLLIKRNIQIQFDKKNSNK